jgi:hypothetical protein
MFVLKNQVANHWNEKGIAMSRTYDRRFFAPLAFLFFLFFLGTSDYQHLASLAAPASLASLAALMFVP